jgi:putative tricarboxylic transport membrane protein
MARADVVAAGGVLLLAAVAAYEAAKLPLGTTGNPGPGFVPWWAAVALGLLALLRLGQLWIARPVPAAGEPGRRAAAVGGLVVALVAYVALVEALGYPLSTFLLVLVVVLRLVEPRRWAVALGVAAVAAIASFVVFAVWLKVPLPPGPPFR